MIDRIPAFRMLVDSYIDQGQEFYQEVGRLYGIGAALDPAGVRFSVVLILIAYLLCEDDVIRQDRKKITGFLVCFFIISYVLGKYDFSDYHYRDDDGAGVYHLFNRNIPVDDIGT